MARIINIEGIGPEYKRLLKEKAGITSTEALLDACRSPEQREGLAAKIGVSPTLVLEWANLADLFRVRGIGEEYSDLLEEAGVDTVVELAQRNAENLFAAMKETNSEKLLVRRMPSLGQVQDWVKQAKALPRVLTY